MSGKYLLSMAERCQTAIAEGAADREHSTVSHGDTQSRFCNAGYAAGGNMRDSDKRGLGCMQCQVRCVSWSCSLWPKQNEVGKKPNGRTATNSKRRLLTSLTPAAGGSRTA